MPEPPDGCLHSTEILYDDALDHTHKLRIVNAEENSLKQAKAEVPNSRNETGNKSHVPLMTSHGR